MVSTVVRDFENFREGRQVERLHKYRERNAGLVSAAKEVFLRRYGRLFCEACGFDFHQVYGERCHGLIEVHHDVPLSEMTGDSRVTTIDEVSLVCSNCHRIIHRTRPWLTVRQLAEFLASSPQCRI